MPELLTFDAANRWLTGRVNVPTGLTSAELAMSPDFPAQVRAHAFFSAQVQSAEALEAMREEIDAVAAGTTDYASARARLKDVLSRRGWAPDDVSSAKEPPPGMDEDEWKARKRLTNLASTRRLDLVLRQNVAMAHAVGQREVSMNPVLLERFPYFRYIARSDARTTHGALNNVILRKDDPFWNTHTPPWEFNCRCMIEDADAEDAARYGGAAAATAAENQDGSRSERVVNAETGAAVDVPPSPSGFVFRIDEPFTAFEMSRVQNIPTRRAVMMRLRALARTSGARFNCTLRSSLASPALADPREDLAERLIQDASAAIAAGRDVPAAEATVGRLSGELLDAIGLDAAAADVKLGGGKVGRAASPYGFQHQIDNHPAAVTGGGMAEALRDTLFAGRGVRAAVGFNGGAMYLNLINPETGSLTTIYRHGDVWQIASADKRSESYRQRQEGLTGRRPRPAVRPGLPDIPVSYTP